MYTFSNKKIPQAVWIQWYKTAKKIVESADNKRGFLLEILVTFIDNSQSQLSLISSMLLQLWV
jgi:hypothetical protein